ncbi:MAG: DUF3572 domain-containing protein [Hyphomicrobiaceae bacterium]|jgi:hypothetical protein|nr:DUF3572 domain-containing protein [Hyphomicrobiaceae bacterium]
MTKRSFTPQQVAETVAIQALSYLVSEPARLGRFLADTGLGPETIRKAAGNPEFLTAVLDHVLGDERLAKEFAQSSELPPDTVRAAREALGGPAWERETP